MSFDDDSWNYASADGCRQYAAYLEKLDGCDASNSVRTLYVMAAGKERAARKHIEDYGVEGAKAAAVLLGKGREREVKDLVLDIVKRNLEDLLGE